MSFFIQVVPQTDTAGQLYTWGSQTSGGPFFGVNNLSFVNPYLTPFRVGTDINWDYIDTGEKHVLGIRDGSLYVWGNNTYGQLGTGDTNQKTTPTIVGSASDWQVVASDGSSIISNGEAVSLGIRNDKLYAWGSNYNARTGLGLSTGLTLSPQQVGNLSGWSSISVNAFHSLGICNGALYSWGDNYNGITGQGTSSGVTTSPQQVGTSLGWTAVAAGYLASFGIRNGELYAWGDNLNGRTGLGLTSGFTTSPQRIGTSSGWSAISASQCALGIKNGELYSWGFNGNGQLGLGDTQIRSVPTQVGNASDWLVVSAADLHSLGIRNGQLFAWGGNTNGGTAQNTVVGNTLTPQLANDVDPSLSWIFVEANRFTCFGIKA